MEPQQKYSGYEGPIKHPQKPWEVMISLFAEKKAEGVSSRWRFVPSYENEEDLDKILELHGPLTITFSWDLVRWVASLLSVALMADVDFRFWLAILRGVRCLIGDAAITMNLSPF